MEQGWIKLHRQITEWEWYPEINVCYVFLHLLLIANHREKRYKGMDLKAGSIVTSREKLSKDTGLSLQQIRTILNKLKSTNEITINSSFQGTVIEVVNYQLYQCATSDSTGDQPTINQRSTTNKNVKNEKNVEIPSLDEFLSYAISKDPEVNRSAVGLKYESWIENDWSTLAKGKKQPIKNWKSTLLNTIPYLGKEESSHDPYYESIMNRINKKYDS